MSDQPAKRPAFEPAARLLAPTRYDPQKRRPATTIAAAVLVLLRVIAGVFVLIGLAAGWSRVVPPSAAPPVVVRGERGWVSRRWRSSPW
jgi:hypothetical protein